jgi:hypothetical protein
MTETGQLRIRTIQDIIDALRSAEPAIRVSILRAIIQHPDKVAAYGASGGWDILDELCSQARNLEESPLRTLVLGALVAYKDPRVWEIFKNELHASENAETLTLAARYLSGADDDIGKEILSSFLLQDNSVTHARVAADAMAGHGQLSDRERIRVAMLSTGDVTPPNLNEETEPLWSGELRGPYHAHARRLIEAQGEASFIFLRKRWDRLNNEDKRWLLEWGPGAHPAHTVELILLGLDSGCDVLALASLEAISGLGEAGRIFATQTGRHLNNRNPAVRLAVARAGAAGVDWEAALSEEENTAVKMEMLMRLTEQKGAVAAPILIRLMEEGDYQVCAAVTSALKTVSKDVTELMKPLMVHPSQSVQVAAAQVLIDAGEELWLEEQMLC